jgi:hypothetical protein
VLLTGIVGSVVAGAVVVGVTVNVATFSQYDDGDRSYLYQWGVWPLRLGWLMMLLSVLVGAVGVVTARSRRNRAAAATPSPDGTS